MAYISSMTTQAAELTALRPYTVIRNGHFKALMLNFDTLEEVCRDYMQTAQVPNIAGLCAVLGTTPPALKRLFGLAAAPDPLETYLEDKSQPHPEALAIIANTIMQIENNIVSQGLAGNYNAHMSKFILSAFHERHEKQLQESHADKTVTIHVKSHNPISLDELRELDRLEGVLEEQQEIELAAMGKSLKKRQIAAQTAREEDYLI